MKYHNVTISGLPGSGLTTLSSLLLEKMQSLGWRKFSGGEFMRMYAAGKGLFDAENNKFHHDATVYDEEFDREVDYGMRKRLEVGDKWIIESWLSGFMAQGVQGVLKVLLVCEDDAVRIDRIANRDGISIDEAKTYVVERKEKNVEKWMRMYEREWSDWVVKEGKAKPGDRIDFWLPLLYDVVIDTRSNSREETLETVLKALHE